MQTKQRPDLNETIVVKFPNEFLRAKVEKAMGEGYMKEYFFVSIEGIDRLFPFKVEEHLWYWWFENEIKID